MNISSVGTPGYKTPRTATPNDVLAYGSGARYANGYRVLDGSKSRDAGNTDAATVLRGGTPVGKITSGGKYAMSIIGASDVAYASGTSLSLTEAAGDEVVRRIGSSGTFKLTGPPAAGGTVRSVTVTFSSIAAAGSGHRVATITAISSANQVDQIMFNAAGTAGNLQLTVYKPDGTTVTTANSAWSATDATLLSNLNSALDTATGVVGGIVATAIPGTDTDWGVRLTYSGTGYAGKTWGRAAVAVFFTTATAANYVRITDAVDPAFISGSLVQPTDGSETVKGIDNSPWGSVLVDENQASIDVPLTNLLDGGHVEPTRIPNYTAWDSSLQSWLKTALKAAGPFTFTDDV